MAEPAGGAISVSVVSLAVAIAGPLFGPYAVIFFSALAGALWPLLTGSTDSRAAGFGLLARVVTMALVLTGFISLGIERFSGIPALELLPGVAFFIAWLGNGWRSVIGAAQGALITIVSQWSAGGANRGK